MTSELLPKDILIRYDRVSKTISFLVANPGKSHLMTQVMHELEWDLGNGVLGVIDIGAAVSAFLHSSYQEEFCSPVEWEKLAEDIRTAAGRE